MACGSFQRNCMSSQHRIGHGGLLIRGLEVTIIFWSLQHLLSLASLQPAPVHGLSSDLLSELQVTATLPREAGQATELRHVAQLQHDSNKRAASRRQGCFRGRKVLRGGALRPVGNLACSAVQRSSTQASATLQLRGLGCSGQERGAAREAGCPGVVVGFKS